MKRFSEYDTADEPLYLAGANPPPGLYQDIATGKTYSIDGEDLLPASLDGHVACYRRLSCTWRQIKGGTADQRASVPSGATITQSASNALASHVSASSDLGKVTARS